MTRQRGKSRAAPIVGLGRAILDAIAAGRREDLEPKSIYLTPDDRRLLGNLDELGGLPIKPVSGKGKSKVYFDHGIAKRIARPSGLAPRRPAKTKGGR